MTRSTRPIRDVRSSPTAGTPPLEYAPQGFTDDSGVYVQVSMYQSGRIELAFQSSTALVKQTIDPDGAVALASLLDRMGKRAKTVRARR